MKNVLSDLSSELAVAMLVEKQRRQVPSDEARDLIKDIRRILNEDVRRTSARRSQSAPKLKAGA